MKFDPIKETYAMKGILVSTLAAGALLAAGFANASDQSALAQSKGCLACHSVDKKIVGPAYKDVAKKYAGDKGAEAKLVDKVIKGGVGAWGQVPMPPNNVSKEDATKLVQWVLSLK
jgi:cytochrome c